MTGPLVAATKSRSRSGAGNQAAEPPIASLDAADLDEIDRAGSMAQLGYVAGPDD